jgi:hypothetical protein
MALLEISGSSKPHVAASGTLRIDLGLGGTAKPHIATAGTHLSMDLALAGSAKPHVAVSGAFGDVAPVASVVVNGPTSLRVNFSEPMENNLALQTPGSYVFAAVDVGVLITCSGATPEAVSEPNYVDLTTTEMTDGEDYELTVDPAVVDLQGTPTNAVATFTGEGLAPQVSSATAVTSTKVRVEFDEDMDVADGSIDDPTNYLIEPTEAGAASVAVQEVERSVHNDARVDLVCSEMTDAKAYKVTVSSVRDAAHNPIDPAGDEAAFTGEGLRPTVARVEAISQNRMDVIFDEPMRDNADIRDSSRYGWDQGLNTLSVLEVDGATVKLVTDDQEPGLLYTLTISNP